MPRPRVICHMLSSVDGRIAVTGWPITAEGRQHYELVHAAPFDVEAGEGSPARLVLEHVERRVDDVLWLRYRVEAAR